MNINEVRHLHIELTTKCNARCPMCLRNVNGYEHNNGYPLSELFLEDFKKIFSPIFLTQIETILFNGNLGDFAVARDGLEIIKYASKYVKDIEIQTNGSVRNTNWWSELAKYNVHINFALDGLEDTHHLYRIDTSFNKVLNNAKAFINSGGKATWTMIAFDHNKHQIKECEELSKQYNFVNFDLADGNRDTCTVYNRDGTFAYNIGTVDAKTISQPIDFHIQLFDNDNDINADFDLDKSANIKCNPYNIKQIYIAGNGEVYPCCFTGVFPTTMKYMGNPQIKQLVRNNNALEYPLEECIKWFDSLYKLWGTTNQPLQCIANCSNPCQ